MKAPLGAEDRLVLEGATGIVGIDEVGRGALAGPVVVCGVRLTVIPEHRGIRDSKTLSESRRNEAATWARENAARWGVVEVWPETIDRINILEATRSAMRAIARSLAELDDAVVVDAVELGPGFETAMSPKKADGRFFCVAAASNIAKVYRDSLMVRLAQRYPRWGWEKNKGYGTPAHLEGLSRDGRTPLHRRSFRCSVVLP